MSIFGLSIGFAAPWLLSALLALPLLWWLLRLLPPRPRMVRFPSLRLLRDLVATEQTPARLPWWLMLLRIVLAALLILAAAQPTLNPRPELPGDGPIVMLIDNGWAAAQDWPRRMAKVNALLDRQGNAGRPILMMTTAAPASGEPMEVIGPLSPVQARERLGGLEPMPWQDDLATAVEGVAVALNELPAGSGRPSLYWFSDGLDRSADAAALQKLARLGEVTVLKAPESDLPVILLPPSLVSEAAPEEGEQPAGITVHLERPTALEMDQPVRIQSIGSNDRLLGDQTIIFPAASRDMDVTLEVPTALRNDLREIRLVGVSHAAARTLLDDRWVRRPVGLVAGGNAEASQPLLDQLHYLRQAMQPFAELHSGEVEELLKTPLSVMILADIGRLTPEMQQQLEGWIAQGGVLVRFAGPQLAATGGDDLLPVKIRQGDRTLGGALSWSEPVALAPFNETSPFAGLELPRDVTVRRQILAEPSLDLNEKTWARLVDGTPLVTAEARGAGYLVLFHTTASPDWSNLALSGLFVEMLRRLTLLSTGVTIERSAEADSPLTLGALQVMDGFGILTEPGPIVKPLTVSELDSTGIDPSHPPGVYGRDGVRRALNLAPALPALAPLGALPASMGTEALTILPQTPLLPWLILAALALLLLDWLLAIWLSGGLDFRLPRLGKRGGAMTAAILLTLAMSLGIGAVAQAQGLSLDDERALKVSTGTYLGYVLTGDRKVDETSHAGLDGLAGILRRRTAAEVDGAIAVDIVRDDLALFPFLYWPIVESQPDLDSATVSRINFYLRHGGMIIFDTRDKLQGGLEQAGPGVQKLRQLTRQIDMPPLKPVGPNHVLTRSFYLLQIFPGRYAGGEVWVEQTDERRNDGVASVIIGSHDWAGAWAVGADNRPLLPVVPGGERQRELAYRFGVNLVMYALTGNYKADQVHVPYILERLGQ